MGADGGLIFLPIKGPDYLTNWLKVKDLLKPFYQFLDTDGVSCVAENANNNYLKNNSYFNSPKFLIGCYGTDRPDCISLSNLPSLLNDNSFNSLTFEELDLEIRTCPNKDSYYLNLPFIKLMEAHFHFSSREEVILSLDNIANMTISLWSSQLKERLIIGNLTYEETWT